MEVAFFFILPTAGFWRKMETNGRGFWCGTGGVNNFLYIMPKEKFIITFAGPVGCSKTPVAYYLSWKLGLPILNNDAMRTETVEDLGKFDEKEYLKRRDERIDELLKKGSSFIYDASIDRVWKDWKDRLLGKYEVFMISFDLSKGFIMELYAAKKYDESIRDVDKFIADHDKFLEEFADKVNLQITDENFKDRLRLSYEAAERWMRYN